MQIAYAFLPAAVVAIMGLSGEVSSPPPSAPAANMAFSVSWTDEAKAAEHRIGGDKALGKGNHHVLRNSPRDRLFYVTARVNGKPVRFVVDTGSSVVILTRSDALAAGVKDLDGPALSVTTASGASAMRAVNLDKVELAGQALENVDGAIVDADLKVSLLGQSALSRLQSIRFVGNTLELN